MHTHSAFATSWAQARREIPCFGTTHADHFDGAVPVTRPLTPGEIEGEYERETGEVIIETFAGLGREPLDMPAVLVASHGPFTWGAIGGRCGRERDRARGRRDERVPLARSGRQARAAAGRTAPAAFLAQARGFRLLRSAGVKALRLQAAGELQLHEEPDPEPEPGQVLVRVGGVGLCGSDRHWFLEGGIGDAVLGEPLVLGHEFAGVVASGPRRGERVVLDPAIPCGRCALCLAGDGHLCAELRFAGHGSTDGGLRTLVAWPEQLAHPLPGSISDEAAPLLEPLGVALHAVDLGGAGPGTTAAVFGCGPIGLLLVQVLQAAGVTVELAADPLPHRAAAARAFGARRSDPAGVTVDVAYEAAGDDGALDRRDRRGAPRRPRRPRRHPRRRPQHVSTLPRHDARS